MTTRNFSKLVKDSVADLPHLDLLKEPTDSLLGVGKTMATTLREELKIYTIFELATSWIFNGALNLVAPQSDIAIKDDLVSGDILRNTEVNLATIGAEKIEKLRFKEGAAAKIEETLGVQTIRDFAFWTPFQMARAILQATFGTEDEEGNGVPEELVPKSGNQVSEKIYNETTYIIDADEKLDLGQKNKKMDLLKTALTEMDLLKTALTQEYFNEAALGVRVLSEQAWYSEGITLGQMIYSLALAPGEVTRLSVTNRTQRTADRRSEALEETSDRTEDTSNEMSISEITDSVVKESNQGFNRNETTSDADRSGYGGASIFGNFGGVGGSSTSRNSSVTNSVSRSKGSHNLSSKHNQDINSRSHNKANATRKQQSIVMQESREDEDETLSTRVVANYNHMHPLTMQYYEVVQNYRVKTRAIDYERRLFVPIKLFSFKDPLVILRYNHILQAFTKDEEVKEQLASANESNWHEGKIVTLIDSSGNHLHEVKFSDPKLVKIDYKLQGRGFIDGIQLIFNDGTILSSGLAKYGLAGDLKGKAKGSAFVDSNIPVSQIAKVLYDPDYARAGQILTLTYHFQKDKESPGKKDQTDSYTQTITIGEEGYGYEAIHFQIKDKSRAIQHLEQNALYYSQRIWLNMEPADWFEVLGKVTYDYDGERISRKNIQPVPVALLGNCVGFPWHFANEKEKLNWLLKEGLLERDFKTWLAEHHYPEDPQDATEDAKDAYLDFVGEPHGDAGLQETLIPMPTEGVFAEAVLGRFNCAEKIDHDRFWDWQTSPIQIMPSEIGNLTANGLTANGDKAAAKILSVLLQSTSPQAAINAAASKAAGKLYEGG